MPTDGTSERSFRALTMFEQSPDNSLIYYHDVPGQILAEVFGSRSRYYARLFALAPVLLTAARDAVNLLRRANDLHRDVTGGADSQAMVQVMLPLQSVLSLVDAPVLEGTAIPSHGASNLGMAPF